ncbi:MAG: pyridoxal phosphate-dependent aminotransferase [Desulfobacterales bacterium]
MFSDRFDWNLPPNPLSRLLDDKKRAGEAVFDLTESNPTRVGLTYPADDILAALSRPAAMTYAPDPRGLLTARRAIGGYYRDRGVSIDADALFLTAGTSDAYAILFKLLGNPGDEVLIPRPGYPLLSYLARFEGLDAGAYPLRYDVIEGWSIDLEVLRALITPRTRAIVLIDPNNPTGSYVKPAEWGALAALGRRHELSLIVDEVFCDFGAGDSAGFLPQDLNRLESLTFVLNGFSKSIGLPQVKLGWIAVAGNSVRSQVARMHLETLLDFYLSVGTPVQHAADALLARRHAIQRQILARIDANSRFLEKQIASTGNCRVLKREGGWYAVVDILDTVSDEERVLQLLADDNTLVHPGFFYDFNREGFVVVSLLPAEDTFCRGVSRLIGRYGR